jgi:hypothetical protein
MASLLPTLCDKQETRLASVYLIFLQYFLVGEGLSARAWVVEMGDVTLRMVDGCFYYSTQLTTPQAHHLALARSLGHNSLAEN